MGRKFNFSAGPSTLPLPVLQKLQAELSDFHNAGYSLIETSHRGPEYDSVHNDAIALLRELLSVPETHDILLLGGGATLQFAMVPMNLRSSGQTCSMAITGSWSKKAKADAAKTGEVYVDFDGADSNYTTLPQQVTPAPGSAYYYFTSNETIGGVQWQTWPETGETLLVSDMSSDIMTRSIPFEKFALVFAGAQKNLGPAGVTVVIVKKDLLEKGAQLPAYLSYKTHAEKQSMYNTPPVFSIWALKLVLEWVKEQGGLAEMEGRTQTRADLIYNAISRNTSFYNCPVAENARSKTNIVFTLPSKELEKQFMEKAAEKDMVSIKGHRSVGGIRISLYNAMPLEGARKMAEFMDEFATGQE